MTKRRKKGPSHTPKAEERHWYPRHQSKKSRPGGRGGDDGGGRTTAAGTNGARGPDAAVIGAPALPFRASTRRRVQVTSGMQGPSVLASCNGQCTVIRRTGTPSVPRRATWLAPLRGAGSR